MLLRDRWGAGREQVEIKGCRHMNHDERPAEAERVDGVVLVSIELLWEIVDEAVDVCFR